MGNIQCKTAFYDTRAFKKQGYGFKLHFQFQTRLIYHILLILNWL